MSDSDLLRDIESLPTEAQKEIRDFVAFLKTRYTAKSAKAVKRARRVKLEDEPFIGMWKDREDMKDSVEWVSRMRDREWHRPK